MTRLDPYGAFVDRVGIPVGGDGPLSALRVAVKDNIAVAGSKWTCGLPLLADRVAEEDAASVAILRAAGAVIAGTTATDAAGFGMMTPGVINPLAADRTAGGSSGGSAAAVAAGLADFALGTDTGGSVRVPAACCGLFGLKPTYGRVSVEGVTPLSTSFDHVGFIAADIDILERAARVLLPDVRASVEVPKRIGFDPVRLSQCDDVIRAAVDRVLVMLAAEGFELVEVGLPDTLELAEIHGAIVCAEALEVWRDHWPRDAGRFGDTARRSLAYAATVTPDVLAGAMEQLPVVRAMIARAFDEADAIIGPTIAVATPRSGARRADFLGTQVPVVFALLAEACPYNVSGHPALSLPLPWPGAGGIPVALQVATPHDGEFDAIGLARAMAVIVATARGASM